MIGFRKIFIWHMNGSKWEDVLEKCSAITSSFKNVHQRFMDRREDKHRHKKGRKGSNKTN
jgi:hypothetical protein